MIDIGERLKHPLPGPSVLLFGSLALSFDEAAFAQILETVVETDNHSWILKTIAELPQCWKTITAAFPSLKDVPGLRKLEDMVGAFQTGRPLETPFPLPNTLLVPLVVILHLTQYVTFLTHTRIDLDDRIDHFAASKRDMETIGLCTGLLSAFAVSSASNNEQFLKYGAVAVRLGVLIGMIVDAQDAVSELKTSKSLSTAWNSNEGGEKMLRILKNFPEVRITPLPTRYTRYDLSLIAVHILPDSSG